MERSLRLAVSLLMVALSHTSLSLSTCYAVLLCWTMNRFAFLQRHPLR